MSEILRMSSFTEKKTTLSNSITVKQIRLHIRWNIIDTHCTADMPQRHSRTNEKISVSRIKKNHKRMQSFDQW
jgi:hypothetical protein